MNDRLSDGVERRRRTRRALVALTALVLGALATMAPGSPAGAATITVCASGCDHTSIAAAVTAAAPGDTVDVAAGTYAETSQILINKPLHLHGAGSDVTIITTTAAALGTIRINTVSSETANGGQVTIEGLTVPTTGTNSSAHHTGVLARTTATGTPGPIDLIDVAIEGKGSSTSQPRAAKGEQRPAAQEALPDTDKQPSGQQRQQATAQRPHLEHALLPSQKAHAGGRRHDARHGSVDAPVHADHLAGDVRRLVRAQEDDQ